MLAGQNQVLADLAVDSDRVLAPLARDRAQRVRASSTNAQGGGGGDRRAQRGPGGVDPPAAAVPARARADDGPPRRPGRRDDAGAARRRRRRAGRQPLHRAPRAVLADLAALVPHAGRRLGRRGREVLKESEPLLRDARRLHVSGKPLSKDLRDLVVSLRDTGGIEQLVDLFYYLSGSSNGYDEFGHYFRVGLAGRDCAAVPGLRDRAEPDLQRQLLRQDAGRRRRARPRRPRPRPSRRARARAERGARGRDPPASPSAARSTRRPPHRRGRRPPRRAPRHPSAAASRRRRRPRPGRRSASSTDSPSSTTSWGADVRRGSASIAANPVLIGAATSLVVIVAVFLAYNANSGLPFVPTYELKAEVPQAASLVVGQRGAHRRHARRRGRGRSRPRSTRTGSRAPCSR